MYILKMMSGERFTITDKEGLDIISRGRVGKVAIPSLQVGIDLVSYSSCYPEHLADEVEDRKTQLTGVLHDGSRVKRHFGIWVDADQQTVDDNGKYLPITIDPKYYPEVARDCVPTEQEFERIRHLPVPERLKSIIGKYSEPRQIGEPTNIKNILPTNS